MGKKKRERYLVDGIIRMNTKVIGTVERISEFIQVSAESVIGDGL